MDFGTRLKQLRIERKLTQAELGELVKINYSTISDYERGDKKDPLMSTVKTFADFFGVSIDYMTGDSDIRENITFDRIRTIFSQLSDENKRNLINYAEFLRSGQNERNDSQKK